jgi:hypothetical protein
MICIKTVGRPLKDQLSVLARPKYQIEKELTVPGQPKSTDIRYAHVHSCTHVFLTSLTVKSSKTTTLWRNMFASTWRCINTSLLQKSHDPYR